MGRRIDELAPTLLAILMAGCGGDGEFIGGSPGGGNVDNPVPIIESLSPPSGLIGDGGFTLTVLGSNFIGGSIVKWNGVALVSTFNNSSHLTALVPANYLAAAGTAIVVVSNPTPGGGNSGAQTFNINNVAPAKAGITEIRIQCDYASSALSTGDETGRDEQLVKRCTTITVAKLSR